MLIGGGLVAAGLVGAWASGAYERMLEDRWDREHAKRAGCPCGKPGLPTRRARPDRTWAYRCPEHRRQ